MRVNSPEERYQYRLLEKGERTEPGDQFYDEGGSRAWIDIKGWEIGVKYDPGFYFPMRRRA